MLYLLGEHGTEFTFIDPNDTSGGRKTGVCVSNGGLPLNMMVDHSLSDQASQLLEKANKQLKYKNEKVSEYSSERYHISTIGTSKKRPAATVAAATVRLLLRLLLLLD